MLCSADAIISKVLAKVKTLTGKYSAVLTGKHTTMVSPDPVKETVPP